jgi:hypothetical protein
MIFELKVTLTKGTALSPKMSEQTQDTEQHYETTRPPFETY